MNMCIAYVGEGPVICIKPTKLKQYYYTLLTVTVYENGYFKKNEKSHKMQLKFGYKDEGIKRQRFISKATGKVEDEYITGLLKEEWKKTLEK